MMSTTGVAEYRPLQGLFASALKWSGSGNSNARWCLCEHAFRSFFHLKSTPPKNQIAEIKIYISFICNLIF